MNNHKSQLNMLLMNNKFKTLMRFVLRFIDILVILYKFGVLTTLFVRYQDNEGDIKNLYWHLLLPFGLYGLINLLRLLFNKLSELLFIELFMNFVFIFLYGTNHFFFLILTAISIAITYINKSEIFQSSRPV
jgi:hypothetical protein